MKHIILLGLLISSGLSLFAQDKALKKADDLYFYHKYPEAITAYKEILAEGKSGKDVYLTQQIADSYWHLHDYQDAEIWYSKLVQMGGEYDAISHYDYGQLLRDMGKYEEAKVQFAEYVNMSGKTELQEELDLLCDWPMANDITNRALVLKTNIETGRQCMGFTKLDDGLLISMPQAADFDEHTIYYDLATAKAEDTLTFKQPVLLPGETNHSFYEGAPTFTADGKTVYYTANASEKENYKEKKASKYGISHEGVNVLEIYEAKFKNGQWTDIHLLNINDPEHNNAFPHISPDGSRLYFASDRPGGFGMMDLYVCTKNNDSTWSDPVNLGPDINSFENDIYPFVHDHDFYYASRGKPGYGGLDLFKAPYEVGKIGTPVNMGKPINSVKDEFCMVLTDEKDKKGYMASNRDDAHGHDYIYYFHQLDPENLYDTLSGTVLSELTEEPLVDVSVRLYEKDEDGEFQLIDSTLTDIDGYWEFVVRKDREYKVEFEVPGFNKKTVDIPVNDGKKPSNREKLLTKLNPLELEVDVTAGNVITLKNIYFNFDKADIRPDSKKVLDKLVGILKDNPEARIELGAHTDAVGPNDYNMRLSHKRAKSAVKYLIDHGIDKNRLVAKGYGETKILNGCWKWNDCTEEENEINRRVEITFLDKKVVSN